MQNRLIYLADSPKAFSHGRPSIQNQYSWSEKHDSRRVSWAWGETSRRGCTTVHDRQLSPELRQGDKFKLQIVTASLSAHLSATHGALWRASRAVTARWHWCCSPPIGLNEQPPPIPESRAGPERSGQTLLWAQLLPQRTVYKLFVLFKCLKTSQWANLPLLPLPLLGPYPDMNFSRYGFETK